MGAALVLLAVTVLGSVSSAPSVGFGALDAGFELTTGEGPGLLEPRVTASTEIVVDVAGAVVRPGLHVLQDGDRVGDAIEAAGGFAAQADLAAASEALNLAQPLTDGIKVMVPELGTDRPPGSSSGDERIDINRAGQAELETLPGIGPVTARKIVDARATRPFETVRDLRSRGLVGESVFTDLRSLVRVG